MEPERTVDLRTPQSHKREGLYSSGLSQPSRPAADGLICPWRWQHGIHLGTEVRRPLSGVEKRICSLCYQRMVHGCNSNPIGTMGSASQRSCRVCPEDVVGAGPSS